MKNAYSKIFLAGLLNIMFLMAGTLAFAQQANPDFGGDTYKEAIQDISDLSGGRLDRTAILNYLINEKTKSTRSPLTYRGDTIFTQPEIAFAQYNQSSVAFQYFTESTFDTIIVTFPENTDWLSNPDVNDTDSTITIDVAENPNITPRSTEIFIKGILNLDTIPGTAYVLQAGKPQHFILVSPKYQTVSPQGDTTKPFTVTTFNVESWTAVFSEIWIHVDLTSLTNESITFVVDPNSGNILQNATIEIQDADDPDVKDELTIIQYVDTSDYIIATPSSGTINSSGTVFEVAVNANIQWTVDDTTNVSEGMISNYFVSAGNDTVSFQILVNADTTSRTAEIYLNGIDNPDVSAQIVIVQEGSSPPYLFVSPKISYVGSNIDSVTLNVDANVTWETDFFNNPDGMLSKGLLPRHPLI